MIQSKIFNEILTCSGLIHYNLAMRPQARCKDFKLQIPNKATIKVSLNESRTNHYDLFNELGDPFHKNMFDLFTNSVIRWFVWIGYQHTEWTIIIEWLKFQSVSHTMLLEDLRQLAIQWQSLIDHLYDAFVSFLES